MSEVVKGLTHTHTHIQYPSALELILMVAGENLAREVSLERQS